MRQAGLIAALLGLGAVGLPAGPPAAAVAGFSVRLLPDRVPQGGALRVEVAGGPAEERPVGTLDGRKLGFFRPAGGKSWEALAGVDLDLPAGRHPVAVTLGGLTRKAMLTIAKGKYQEEHLTMPPEKAAPTDAAAARRVARDQKRAREAGMHHWDHRFAGVLRVPCEGKVSTTSFGSRRFINGIAKSPHGGTDISAPVGRPVGAAADGVVRLVDDMFYSGNTVFVDHGSGWMTTYFHLSRVDVKEGQAVVAGQAIGQVGATGRATGPHLHWGLQWLRARIDPLQLTPGH